MRKFRRIALFFTAAVLMSVAPTLAAPASAPSTAATKPSQGSRFMRFVGDSKTGGRLETADITYENDSGQQVRLVSAVHIADADYFKALNESFRSCDVVLYEMVKPKELGVPKPGGPRSDIARLQMFLKDTLDLEFQLDAIDYEAKNFVHADLDAEEFQRMQAARGESFASLMLASMLRQLTDPATSATYDDEPVDSFDLMTRPDGTRQFKLILARRMGDIEKDAMGFGAMDGTVILTERNKAGIKVLRETLKEGKRKIAIFYGAAHMPDLSDRLDLLGFRPVSTEWRPAWDVHIRDNQPSAFARLVDVAARAAATSQPAGAK